MAVSQTTTKSLPGDRTVPINIRSNNGPHVSGQWHKPTSKDTPFHEIKRRLREDGYVFVKGLLP